MSATRAPAQVDARHIEIHLNEEKPDGVENEAVEQVAFADRLLLNKTDLVDDDEAELARLEARLREVSRSQTYFCAGM